ncbi:MAG: phosphopantetheine-binding protein [Bacteroidota bacterium]
MKKRYIRRLSLNERLYLIGQEISPSYTLQFLLEGIGEIDERTLQASLEKLVAKVPILRLKVSGSKWTYEGKMPKLYVHERDISSDVNHEIFKRELDARAGVIAEFHLFRGKRMVLLFRILHIAVDAKGAQLILRNLFSLLRGEEIDAIHSFPSDEELRKLLLREKPKQRAPYTLKWPSFTLDSPGNYAFQTAVLEVNQRIEAPLAKVARYLANHFQEPCRFLIPVDLRRHGRVPDVAANLSLPIYVEVSPNSSWKDIQADILYALKEEEELAEEASEKWVKKIPNRILKSFIKGVLSLSKRNSLYPMSGILSDNGYIDLSDFSTAVFKAEKIISLPVFVPLAPFCLNVLQEKERTILAFSVPKSVNLDDLKSGILDCLQEMGEVELEVPISVNQADSPILVELWAEILECPQDLIESHSKFHELGGDSLKLLSMLTEVAAEFELERESEFVHKLLNTAGDISIAQLSQYIEAHQALALSENL